MSQSQSSYTSQPEGPGPWNIECRNCGDKNDGRIIYYPEIAFCKNCQSKNVRFRQYVDLSRSPGGPVHDKQTF